MMRGLDNDDMTNMRNRVLAIAEAVAEKFNIKESTEVIVNVNGSCIILILIENDYKISYWNYEMFMNYKKLILDLGTAVGGELC